MTTKHTRSVQLKVCSLTYQQTGPAGGIESNLSLEEWWHCLPAARLPAQGYHVLPEGA